MKISKILSINSLGLMVALTAVVFLSNCSRSPQQQNQEIDGVGTQSVGILVAPTYSSLYQQVFSARCVECHRPGGSAMAAGSAIDFSNATFGYTTIVNQNVSGISSVAVCGGAKIASNKAASSYILATFFPDFGLGSNNWNGISGCTPYDHTAFQTSVPSGAEKAALVQWLNQGAPNN